MNELSLHAFLKQETAPAHSETESLLEAGKIFTEIYHLENYINLLSILYNSHLEIENAIEEFLSRNTISLQVWYESKRKLLEMDLLLLGKIIPRTDPSPWKIENEFHFLGAIYVLKGSELGASVLYRELQKHTARWGKSPTNFYGFKSNLGWKDFCIYMNSYPDEKNHREEIKKGALDTFGIFKNNSQR